MSQKCPRKVPSKPKTQNLKAAFIALQRFVGFEKTQSVFKSQFTFHDLKVMLRIKTRDLKAVLQTICTLFGLF